MQLVPLLAELVDGDFHVLRSTSIDIGKAIQMHQYMATVASFGNSHLIRLNINNKKQQARPTYTTKLNELLKRAQRFNGFSQSNGTVGD